MSFAQSIGCHVRHEEHSSPVVHYPIGALTLKTGGFSEGVRGGFATSIPES